MRGTEVIVFCTNAAAGTYVMPTGAGNSQGLQGGLYKFLLSCTGTPSAQLEIQDASGNWVNAGAAFVTTSGGSFDIDLPPGQVRVVISTSTANYAQLVRQPIE